MRVGLFTDALPDWPLEQLLELLRPLPVRDVEIGTGGYSPAPHVEQLSALGDDFRLAALNVSGNPLEVPEHDRALRETIELAAKLRVERVVCMSGGLPQLSGGGWFPGVEELTDLYWRDRVLPYWREIAEHAEVQLCFELEPGAAAFNVSTVERLLDLAPNLMVNLDPSHFFWQSIDPLEAVRRLAGRIGYAHGKDTVLLAERVAVDGVLDRSTWRYATVGHGRGIDWWRLFVEELQRAGYDGVLSIEYEDPEIGAEQSIVEAAELLVGAVAERV
jgi:sugar phosphate isomerase/epimerase